MKKTLWIFDMDGTILNTLEDLFLSVNAALSEHSLPPRTKEEVRCFVGNGIRRLVELAVPISKAEDEETVEAVFQSFNSYYKEHCADNTKPYNRIREVLRQLKDEGVITAVVSNKADYGVQILCRQYFDGLLDLAVGQKEGIRRKPYPDSVNAVLKHFHKTPQDAYYIGDSEVDIATARNAGLPCLSVTWGFRSRKELEESGGKIFVETPLELLAYVNKE